MSGVEVDRLALRLSGLIAADGRRLAERVADGLAAWRPPPDLVPSAEHVRVTVDLQGRLQPVDALAERIVADLVRELERSS